MVKTVIFRGKIVIPDSVMREKLMMLPRMMKSYDEGS